MSPDKRYLMQLSKSDMKELAQVANLEVALPLRIERHGDAAEIRIEERKLKDMLWNFVSQIVPAVTVSRAEAAEISFD